MIPAIRTTALAAALSLIPLWASANAVSAVPDITAAFTELGNQAACVSQSPCVQGPVTPAASGLLFSSAWRVWSSDMTLFGTEPEPAPRTPAAGGYLLNGDRGLRDPNDPTQDPLFVLSSDPLVITLDNISSNAPNAGANQFFTRVTLDLFTNSPLLKLEFLNASGQVLQMTNPVEFTTGNNNFDWGLVDAPAPDGARSLRFVGGNGYTVGVDNLRVWLSSSTTPPPGGNVPEPASFALVGLALLAAGAASRRRG